MVRLCYIKLQDETFLQHLFYILYFQNKEGMHNVPQYRLKSSPLFIRPAVTMGLKLSIFKLIPIGRSGRGKTAFLKLLLGKCMAWPWIAIDRMLRLCFNIKRWRYFGLLCKAKGNHFKIHGLPCITFQQGGCELWLESKLWIPATWLILFRTAAAANARLPASLHAKLPAVLQTSSARSAARASNLIESEESLPRHTIVWQSGDFSAFCHNFWVWAYNRLLTG